MGLSLQNNSRLNQFTLPFIESFVFELYRSLYDCLWRRIAWITIGQKAKYGFDSLIVVLCQNWINVHAFSFVEINCTYCMCNAVLSYTVCKSWCIGRGF